MRNVLVLASLTLAGALESGTVEVCVRGARGLPRMDGSLLHDSRPDPFAVVTLMGVSDAAADCRSVGLLKGEPLKRTAADGSGVGCCRSSKESNTYAPAWPTFCCYFPEFSLKPLEVSVWDDDLFSDELIGTVVISPLPGSSTLQLTGSKCGDGGSACEISVDVTPVLLAGAPSEGDAAFDPGVLRLGEVEVCVLDVHGHGLPSMDALTATDWAVVMRLGYDATFRCGASVYDSTVNSIGLQGHGTAYWAHCCHTFSDVVITATTKLYFELYDSESYFKDQLCCSASVPVLEYTGPFTAPLSGGAGRFVDAKITYDVAVALPPNEYPRLVNDSYTYSGAGPLSAAVPPRPSDCYLLGPPEWGPAQPECLYGPALEFLAGGNILRLPDAFLFPPPGKTEIARIALVTGDVVIRALTVSRIRCSYLEREPFGAKLNGASPNSGLAGARESVAFSMHVTEMTCVASLSAEAGELTSLLHGTDLTFSLADLDFRTDLSLAFVHLLNGSRLVAKTGFLSPTCAAQSGSVFSSLGLARPHPCACDPFDESCKWADFSLRAIEMHLFGSGTAHSLLNELVRGLAPVLKSSIVDSVNRLVMPRAVTVARKPPPRSTAIEEAAGRTSSGAEEEGADAGLCLFGDRCRLFNLLFSRLLGADAPFSLPRMLAAVGFLQPATRERPTSAELRLSGADLADMLLAVLGENPLAKRGKGIAVRAGTGVAAGVLKVELVGLNLTLGARSLLKLGLGANLSAVLAFDFVKTRAAVKLVWIPTYSAARRFAKFGAPALLVRQGDLTEEEEEADLDLEAALSQTLFLGFSGSDVVADAATSALPLTQGASALACALLRLGLAQLNLEGQVAVDVQAASGGAWPDDVTQMLNTVGGLYLRALNGLSASSTGEGSLAEAVVGSILPIVIHDALQMAERCAASKPCPFAAPTSSGATSAAAAEGETWAGGGAREAARSSGPASGSWLHSVGIAPAFAAVVNTGLRLADLVKMRPLLLRLGSQPLRLAPSGSLLTGARWASREGARATFALLPNVSHPSVELRDVAVEARLNKRATLLVVSRAGERAHVAFDHLDLLATVRLQLPTPSFHGTLGRRAATGDGTITSSLRLRLRDVRASVGLSFVPANGSAAAVAGGGAVRPWMLTLGDVLGGVSCVHARVSTGAGAGEEADTGGGAPTLAATVEALELHEGSEVHFLPLEEPILLELIAAWRPWLAAEMNKALQAAEEEEPPCEAGSGLGGLLLAAPLWAVLALLLLLAAAGLLKLLRVIGRAMIGGAPKKRSGAAEALL